MLKFKEYFDFRIPIEMSVCKPKSWAVKFHDKSENEGNMEKKKGGRCAPTSCIKKTELQYNDFKNMLNNWRY